MQKLKSHFIEILNGIETVKSQNIESKSHSIWQRLYNKYINKSFEKIITGTVFLQTSQSLQKFHNSYFMVRGRYGFTSLFILGSIICI